MPAHDLDLLIDAAKAAGEIARPFWSGENTVWDKSPDNPVSDADLAVDTYLKDTLRAARPDYGWLSEETEDDGERLNRSRVFIVDPIDGTRAFVSGQSTWAHSIAVVENGQVTAGVVYLPLREKLYAATLGGGATLNGAPIRTSKRTAIAGSTLLANKWTLEPRYWATTPPVERHFRPSLAYRIALVAEGRFDMMLTFRDSWEWDIAAGALIATEAGATVTDRHGEALTFNSERRKTSGIHVAPDALHAATRKEMA